MNSNMLRVAGFLDNSIVNGSGVRSVIFLSGCHHACKGCQNAAIQDPSTGIDTSVGELVKRVSDNMPYISGVTVSGGEPFDQDITHLLLGVKALGLNVWVYTGYTIEQLISDSRSYITDCLKSIDIIVDGKFDINLTENAPKYAGSTNQRFIALRAGQIDSIKEKI